MSQSFGSSFDDDEAELGVVDDDTGEAVLECVVAHLGLVSRVGEVSNPAKTRQFEFRAGGGEGTHL